MSEKSPGAEALSVSRETYERLSIYAKVLAKWTKRINLVSKNDQSHLWSRHIVDSIQVFRTAPPFDHWVDLGSGGGLPGLVVAILGAELAPRAKVTLIESDTRKAVFLRTAARECDLSINVVNARIETVQPQNADVVSARALADLDALFQLATPHVASEGTLLFPKGKSWGKELKAARERWKFDVETRTSETDPEAVLLIIKGVSRG